MFRIANINKNRSLGKDSLCGFTLIELIIVTVLIAIIIPSVTMLLVRTLNSYENMWIQNKVSTNANFALNRFTNDVNDLISIETATATKIVFENRIGRRVTYELTDTRLKYCAGSCLTDEDFGDIAENVSVEDSEIKYYIYPEGEGMALRAEEPDDQIRFVELVLALSYPEGPNKFSTTIYPDYFTND